MKFILSLSLCFLLCAAFSQTTAKAYPDTLKTIIIAEVSCGQCKFGLPGSGCSLAIRLDENAYFVDGTSIDQHGDAHATDGFCNAIRKAEVQGEVVDKRFKATYFKLLD